MVYHSYLIGNVLIGNVRTDITLEIRVSGLGSNY